MRSPELDGPQCPPVLAHVWLWFCQLSDQRRGNGFDVTAIGFEALQAWAALMRVRPSVFEMECLLALDGQFRVSMTPVKTP